jgi:formylglycine-generating enzyme required for sulfatase activity
MYAKCVEANQCNPPGIKGSYTQFSYFNNPEFSDYPVIYISWNDALSYCSWVGRTLPTEAQWEKASRGVEGQTYPWGNVDAKESLLNFNSIVGDTTKVGSYPKGVSIYGTLDMAGNVSEWVIDWYSDIYYEGSPSSNPLGPDSGKLRVLRGGSWSSSSSEVRSADRNGSNPSVPLVYVGFRCALPRP